MNEEYTLADFIKAELLLLSAVKHEYTAQCLAGELMEIGSMFAGLDIEEMNDIFERSFPDDSNKRA